MNALGSPFVVRLLVRRGRWLLRLAPLAVAACTTTPNILPTNDFNRPTDVAFMCFGAFDTTSGAPATDGGTAGALAVSGRPMRACHPPGGADVARDPGATAATRTFAFMPDSGSGEISIVDADTWRIVDLDPSVGGYGRAPLGTAAEQISASDDGCRIASANRGSCDLSLVDPAVLLSPTFNAATPGLATPLPALQTYRQAVVPHRPDGTPLGAAPYEIAFLPQDTGALDSPTAETLCHADGARVPTVGFPATSGAMPWRALVTFPSCDLIALIELPSGQIVDSWTLADDGNGKPQVVPRGASPPACPVLDCAGQVGAPASDAGASGGAGGATPSGGAGGAPGGNGGAATGGSGGAGTGSPPTGIFRPSGIALAPPIVVGRTVDTTPVRAYVSLSNADYLLSIDVSAQGLAIAPSTLRGSTDASIPVAGVGGSDRIRLSVDPYAPNPTAPSIAGAFVADPLKQRDYLYVVGHDGTIRVVWAVDGQERECETNVDPTKRPPDVSADAWASTACFPVGANRRQFVYTSGIQLPSIPIDVAVSKVVPMPPGGDPSEVTVSGAFAYVLTASGVVYLVNIDPTRRHLSVVANVDNDTGQFVPDTAPHSTYMSVLSTSPNPFSEPTPFASTLRDQNQISYSTALDPFSGPPRIPVVSIPSFTAPFIESFQARGTRNNALALDTTYLPTMVYFQDPTAVSAQKWTVTWEGFLISSRYGGQLSGNTLSDGAGFCSSGVLPGDLVTFMGCTDDTSCLPGYKCHRDPTAGEAPGGLGLQVTGLCVPPDAEAARAASCPAAFQTLRRYEIQEAHQSQLVLRPHLDELVHSSLVSCESRNAKSGGADGGAPNGDGGAASGDGGAAADGGVTGDSSCRDLTDPTTVNFKCTLGPRAYQTGTTRCLETCTTSADCRAGRACWRSGSCVSDPKKACSSFRDCDASDTTSCQLDSESYCVDAPPVTDIGACLSQLVVYNVAAGASYLVSGSTTGLLAYGKETQAGCEPLQPPGDIDWRVVARIPISDNGLTKPATLCTNVHPVPTDPADSTDSAGNPLPEKEWRLRFDSRVAMPGAEGPSTDRPVPAPNQPLGWLKTDPALHASENPCLFVGGPNASDTDPSSQQRHVRALFQNTQLSFVLTNVEWEPAGGLSVGFDVNGGARAQAVVYPPTVEVSSPARIVLGPIDAQPQTATPAPTFAAPYLFVVDRRRLGRSQGGGPTRGQLLRINPIGFAASAPTPVGTVMGTQPIYEDYSRSGGLFPVQ